MDSVETRDVFDPRNEGALRELARELGQVVRGEVRFDRKSRLLYATDASIYEILPVGIVMPRTLEDVQATIRVAARHRVPVLPRGGGTSLAGQSIGAAVIIDMARHMNAIIEIDPDERWARVGPGLVLDHLNAALRPYGLQFGPDVATSAQATIGGMIGNNSSGARSILYGKTVDHVESLDVCLANGEIAPFGPARTEPGPAGGSLAARIHREIRRIVSENREEIIARYPKVQRRVSGYNLDALLDPSSSNPSHLIVGSEGTLAVVTEARLRVVPLPRVRGVVLFRFDALHHAFDATVVVLEHRPAAVEILDRKVLEPARSSPVFRDVRSWFPAQPEAILLVEVHADTDAELRSRIETIVRDVSRRTPCHEPIQALDEATQGRVWALRKASLSLAMRVRGDAKPVAFVEDTAVPPDRLPEYAARFLEILRGHDADAAVYGHAGAGVLHFRPMLNLKDPRDIERMAAIARDVSGLVREFGGAMAGEHGDGIVRSGFLEETFGPRLSAAFREVKRVFDPEGILNPGKIVDPLPMTENLRFGPRYHAEKVETALNFSRDGGFIRSVELCTGDADCHKMRTGTMCPSYIATGEEEHSPRGRANLFRYAISGRLDGGILSPILAEALDLCLSCKGCQAECPTGVDIGRLKAEVLRARGERYGVPLRSRLLCGTALMGSLGSAFVPLSNLALRSRPIRWVLERSLGIDRRRKLPRFSPQTFRAWFRRHRRDHRGGRFPVVLFVDTFTNYHIPEVGRAAVRILEAMGYEVRVVRNRCCGRPHLSKGLLKRARALAEHNVRVLEPAVRAGIPVVGIEPSCIVTFRDEVPDLLRTEAARLAARSAIFIGEFLHRKWKEGEIAIPAPDEEIEVLYHGHCHEKAIVGAGPTADLLRRIPGLRVTELDCGCCGMAGTFGYEVEHADFSRSIARGRLLPEIERRPQAWISASGASCRLQIEDTTGRRAMHPIEILAEAIAGEGVWSRDGGGGTG